MAKSVAFASILFLASSSCAAQDAKFHDFEMLPITEVQGIAHFSECASYNNFCTLWVRLPRSVTDAEVEYELGEKIYFYASVAVIELSQQAVDAMLKPGEVHTFLSGGFRGFSLQISRDVAQNAKLTVSKGGPESGYVYELDNLGTWLAQDDL